MTEAETIEKLDSDLTVDADHTFEPDESQRGISDSFSNSKTTSSNRKRGRKLYCFACHRMEYHYSTLKGKAYHYLFIGLSFGLVYFFGPFRCRCCGHRRHVRYDFLNPWFYVHKWKFSRTSNSTISPKKKSRSGSQGKSIRLTDSNDSRVDSEHVITDEPKRRKRRRRKLRAVPTVDHIGRSRRAKEQADQLATYSGTPAQSDFSIEGLMDSFETDQSRKEKFVQLEKARSEKTPFVGKKAKPRKRIKGKPKRRYARKTKLTGPKIHCFRCNQNSDHFHILKGSSLYGFAFGISFGLIGLIGPFSCTVCRKKRLMVSNLLHPLYYVRDLVAQGSRGYK